jgi:hypothetical protein
MEAEAMETTLFSPYAMWGPHFETELEIIQRHLDQGDRVTLLACGGELAACDVNPGHAARPCRHCVARRVAGVGLLSQRIHVTPFLQLTAADFAELDKLPRRFVDIEQLKGLRVGAFDIGYAVASSLVSQFRDPHIDLGVHADLAHRLLIAAWTVYRSTLNYLQQQHVDRLYLFNGRYAPLRAALRACQERNVACFTHERGHDLQHYALFRDTFPHDRTARDAAIRSAWTAAGAASDREEIAAGWYQGRAAGDGGNWHSYVAAQRSEQLPAGWDSGRHNVAIFPSSEDEFVAIGDGWENPLYKDQMTGLHALLASLAQDDNPPRLYLRVHPNLAGVDNLQTRQIAQLHSPLLTVIPADDPTSTYALLRHADTVLSYGSTVGIEAVYWGIPSVLAGASFYRDLDATYNPATHAELVALLRRPIVAKPKTAALMFGYYFATFGEPFRYFCPQGVFGGTFKGRQLRRGLLTKARVWRLRAAAEQRAEAVRIAGRVKASAPPRRA